MDTRAKQHLRTARLLPRHYLISSEPWSLWTNNKKIVYDLPNTIYDLVHTPAVKEYWKSKDNLSDEVINSVNWEAISITMKETKRTRRVFISKHASGMCGVGKFMKRWKCRDDSTCPRCGAHEDAAHVWKCKGRGAEEVWEKALSNLEGWFNTMNTDPDLQHLILTHLRSWRNDTSVSSAPMAFLEEILNRQRAISWQRFFEGWILSDWAVAQHKYYKSIKCLQTGKRWTVALIKKLWDVAWDLWEHRNGILHEAENVVTGSELRRLNRKVCDAYKRLQQLQLSAHNRHLLVTKLSRLLKTDKVYKETWLSNAAGLLQQGCMSQWNKRHSRLGLLRGYATRHATILERQIFLNMGFLTHDLDFRT